MYYSRSVRYAVSVLLVALIFISIPAVSAGIQYSQTGPEMSVAISGTNEFSPGETAMVVFLIENSGKITYELVRPDKMTPAYLPTTAQTLYATLVSGDSPITVKSDRQIVGELPSGAVGQAVFDIEVPETCETGIYSLLMNLEYEYLYKADQDADNLITYQYKQVVTEVPVTVEVISDVSLEVEKVTSTDLYAGGIGYITFQVKNKGLTNATSTSLALVPVSDGPIVPVENAVYIGPFASGDVTTVQYKVSVAADADASQSYPVELVATYKDEKGLTKTSNPVVVGVQFRPKVTFVITSPPAVVPAGSESIVKVTYQNTGEVTAYQAQARISVVDPFTSNDDNVYLGTIAPGASVDGLFSVKTDGGATVKNYVLDSEIRYTDEENNDYISDNIEVVLDVGKKGDMALVVGGIAVIVILGLVGFFLKKRKDEKGT